MGPLPADPRRQAHGALLGYMFQIWHSVHAWLELKDDEVLYLEGAEDIDVMRPDGATAIQVKHTSTAVTLRSGSVIKAINSFWNLTEQSDKHVRFRFLTTAREAVEQGEPFGIGLPGLVAWKRGRLDGAIADKVRSFLISEGKVSEKLAAFLERATPEDVQSQLLHPVTWETSSDDAPAVEDAIKRKLVIHGDRYGVAPSEATRVVSRLLREAWETAARKGRHLDRLQFLTVFEDETSIRIPRSALTSLADTTGMAGILSFLAAGTALPQITPESPLTHGVPPLYGTLARRQDLVDQYRGLLADRGLLVLTGSTGMGKSTVARLIIYQTGEDWAWFPLARAASEQAAQDLRRLAMFLDAGIPSPRIVIDGLEQGTMLLASVIEHLCGLVYTALARDGEVIITTQQPLLQRWLGSLGLPTICQSQVPRFAESDIVELACALGCPSDVATTAWSRWVLGQTQGHPQLVHARLIRLAKDRWPRPSAEELFSQPAEVVEERARARQQLLAEASEDQRELICRLSLLSGPFRRDHALAIAEIEPGIPRPGEALNPLLGPWVEEVSNRYYRLSPLLVDAGTEAWSLQRSLALRAQLATAVLGCSPRTLIEASEILFQGLLSQAPGPVTSVVASLFDAPEEAIRRAQDEMPWFVAWALGIGRCPFPADRRVNFLVRMVQFRVAVTARPELAAEIAEAWITESASESTEPESLRERYLLASHLCLYHPQLTADSLVSHLEDIAKVETLAAKSDTEVLPTFPQFAEWATSDPITELFRIAIHRNPSPTFLSSLVTAISATTEQLRHRILATFRTRLEDARLLIDATWTYEQNQEKPNWDECLTALRLAADAAETWGLPEMAAAALAAVAVIQDEYLDNEDAALAVLADAETRLGGNRILAEQRATVTLNRKRYQDAMEQWAHLYPPETSARLADDVRSMFGARKGGEAAGYAGDWHRAAQFFLTARNCAQGASHTADAAELLGDAGFAYWRAGEGRLAFGCFEEGLRLLDSLPDQAGNLRSLVAFKRFGHVLLWVTKSRFHNVTQLLALPQPGMCSQPGRLEGYKELPLTPVVGLWVLLAELEYQYGPGDQIFVEATRRLDEAPVLTFAVSHSELDIRRSLRAAEHPRAVRQCLLLNRLLFALWQVKESGGDSLTKRWGEMPCPDERFSMMTLQASLLVAVTNSGLDAGQRILAGWRTDASGRPGTAAILAWLDDAEEILSIEGSAAYVILRDEVQGITRRWVAALRIALDDHSSPGATFYADITLLDWVERLPFRDELAAKLADTVARAWTRHADAPALLHAPRLTVPDIKRECLADHLPLKKVAKILGAARQAIAASLSDGLLELLRRCS
jgi:hypothetical protein